ncbi:hypothetical protein D3C81_1826040 [compost metagenome]
MEDSTRKDLTNLRASAVFLLPIHCPTTVISVKDSALAGICITPAREEQIALVAIAYVPRLTMKICVRILPPLKNICSAANGRPINIILLSMVQLRVTRSLIFTCRLLSSRNR